MTGDLVEQLRRNSNWRNEKWQCVTDPALLTEAADHIEVLEAENERLREALQFYAREYNWKSSGVYMCGHSNPSSAEIDRGNKARAALGGKQ